jgi:hypothetical protein
MDLKEEARLLVANLEETTRVHRVRFYRIAERFGALPETEGGNLLLKDARTRVERCDVVAGSLTRVNGYLDEMTDAEIRTAIEKMKSFTLPDDSWDRMADRMENLLDELEERLNQ